jgi:hypothetical protein
LIEYAGHEFALDARQKDGATLREHLEKIQQQSGKTPKQLESVDRPDAALYLWEWFIDLSNGRQYGECGAMPLSYAEMQAWSNLRRIRPEAWEAEAIRRLDHAYLNETAKNRGGR